MSWVIWLTGLPGSGKSCVAEALNSLLPDTAILRMDELRKIVTPRPSYSDRERDLVYRGLVFSALTLNRADHNVLIDATAHRKVWRELARSLIADFYEVYLKCPIDVCIKRESERQDRHSAPAGIYEKGAKGSPVPGAGTSYDEPDHPELEIDTSVIGPEKAAEMIMSLLNAGRNTKA